jgi:penicillin-binding protein 1A
MRADLDFTAPQGMTLQQVPEPDGSMVTEAFKTGQVPGAQSNNSLLAGQDGLNPGVATAPPGSPPGTPGSPAPTPPANIDKSLGGLY